MVGRSFRNANQLCTVGPTISLEARDAATGHLQTRLNFPSQGAVRRNL
jgi:hypothetical protein